MEAVHGEYVLLSTSCAISAATTTLLRSEVPFSFSLAVGMPILVSTLAMSVECQRDREKGHGWGTGLYRGPHGSNL